jgi:hypothetical protein
MALVRRAAVGGLVALGTFLAASAVEVVPLLAGAKAPFLSSSSSYYIESLAVHAKYSLSLASNVFGIPREVWLPASFHLGFAPFNSMAYAFFVAAILVLAGCSVRTAHRRIAVVLLGLAVVAWLLASGPDGSAGGAYRVLYDHVPYFKFLRVPNRWLMVSAFSVAVTAGMGTAWLVEDRLGPRRARATTRSRRSLAALGLAALCVVLAFAQAGGVLVRGLPTTTAPAAFTASYAPLAADKSDWRMLTTPYYQAWMSLGGAQHLGNYSTLLSDLGYISSYWTDHNVVGRGGWDPRASEFSQYLYELIAQASNDRLAGLLGAATVKYVGLNPSDSTEVAPGQNAFFLRQQGLSVREHHGAYTVLQDRAALPVAYVTPTFCVVAGGLGVLGDLAQDPSFSFARTGIVFADQVAATGGRGALARLLRLSRCVIEAPGGAASMSVLARANSTASVTALAPSSWLRTAVSPSLDVAADPAVAVTAPKRSAIAWDAGATKPGVQRVFVRALLGPNEGVLGVRVDGHVVGRISLARPAMLGYQWVATPPFASARSAEHVVLTPAGGDNQLVSVAVVPGHAASWRAPRGLDVVHDVNFLDGALYRRLDHVVEIPATRWSSIGARVVSPRVGALTVPRAESGRTYFTLAQAGVRRALDPNLPFGIDFRGTGRGEALYLNVFFSHRLYPTVSYRFLDTSTATRRLFFSPELPTSVRALPDWGAVTGLSLSTNSKTDVTGPYSMSGPFLLATPSDVGVKGQFPAAATRARASLVGDQRVGTSATLHDVGAGLLVFTQSYAPSWSLQGARTAAHTVALGFANGYVVTAPTATATLGFSQARLGRLATMGSAIVWLGALGFLGVAAWRRASRRRGKGRRRSAGGSSAPWPSDGGAA